MKPGLKMRMKQRTTLFLTFITVFVVAGLFMIAPFAVGSPGQSPVQQDETAIAETVNALVNQRFQQTLEAMAPMLTQTAQASGDASLTQTASFDATVNAVFEMALTATAGFDASSVQVTAVPAEPTSGPTLTPVGLRITLRPVEQNDDLIDSEQLEDAADVIDRRLESMGIPAEVDPDSDKAVYVNIPFIADVSAAQTVIEQTGLLEFVDFSGLLDQINTFVDQDIQTTAGSQREAGGADALPNPLTNAPFETVVTSNEVENARAQLTPDGSTWAVVFEFSEDGGEQMSEFTRNHVGEPLAIVLDGHVISIPVIQGEFGSMGGQLAGAFSQEEAERLALQLNAGSLPLELYVERVDPLNELPDAVAEALAANPLPTAGPSPLPSLIPTLDPRPTATVGEIFVAEEVFEHGRMFYVQPVGQIWVMITEGDGSGTWSVYEDTFTDGEPELDPSLVPPEGMYQPTRGFGKLWRENEDVREALGWAVTPEFGYNSEYRYHPGGQLVDGQWVFGPGYHVLFSLDGEAFQFNEADNTWELHVDD